MLQFFIVLYANIAILRANPVLPQQTEAPEPAFVINEIAPNFLGDSYIELISPQGIPLNSNKKYALTILTVESRKVEVHSVFELDKTKFSSSKFYFLLGNPRATWKTSASIDFKGSKVTDLFNKRLYGSINGWLDVTEKMFKAVILTESDTSISEKWPASGQRGKTFLANHPEFENYLLDNQVDGVIMKHYGLIKSCGVIDACIPSMLQKSRQKIKPFARYLDATGGLKWDTPMSWNRCGGLGEIEQSLEQFEHTVFKGGTLSPSAPNDCSKKSWIPDIGDHVMLAPRAEAFTHPCEIAVSESTASENIQVLSEEMVDLVSLNNEMYQTMSTRQPSTCESPDIILNNAADRSAVIRKSNNKRMRVQIGPNGDPNTYQNPDEASAKAALEHSFTLMQNHQPNKFNTELIKSNYWEWFAYKYNPTSPTESKYYCKLCAKHLKGTKFRNDMADEENGVLPTTKEATTDKLRVHKSTLSHQKALELEEIYQASIIDTKLAREIESKIREPNKITARHFRLVYYGGQNYQSFSSHNRLVEVSESNGLDLGSGCRGERAATRIATFIANSLHDDFITSFKRSKSKVTMIADGSDDYTKAE